MKSYYLIGLLHNVYMPNSRLQECCHLSWVSMVE